MNSVPSVIREAEVVELACKIASKFEGCRLKEYLCPAGMPTIGWGKVIKHGEYPEGITQEQADSWFDEDMTERARLVIKAAAGHATNDNELGALSSFVYNCGIEALLASHLWKAFLAGDKKTAANEFPKWCHAGKTVLAGLQRRRIYERMIFLGKSESILQYINVRPPHDASRIVASVRNVHPDSGCCVPGRAA